MPTLLHIDSSPLPGDASFSRQLSHEFVARWREAHPGSTVITRDLTTANIPVVNAEWVGAAFTPEANRTPRQHELLALSHELIAELRTADEYVFGVPMHNFGIPAVLKLWIDQVVRSGQTFTYKSGQPVGLLQNKKATFLVASGGSYEKDTPTEGFDFVKPYLRTIFGFIGVTDVNFIHAGGTARLSGGVDRQTIIQPALDSLHVLFEHAQHA